MAMDHHCDLQKDLTKSIHEFICRHHERPDSSERSKEPLLATHSELIIMALVDMERPASAEDINLWITRLLGADYRDHQWPGCHEYPAESLSSPMCLSLSLVKQTHSLHLRLFDSPSLFTRR
jgi:hypothetical protein